MKPKITRLHKQYCPNCDACIDAQGNNEGFSPVVGDVSICAYCRTLLEDDESLTLVKIKKSTIIDLDVDTLKAIKRHHEWLKKNPPPFKKMRLNNGTN